MHFSECDVIKDVTPSGVGEGKKTVDQNMNKRFQGGKLAVTELSGKEGETL